MSRLAASISFILALNATPEEVADTISAIERQFGFTNAGTVSPSDLQHNPADLPSAGFTVNAAASDATLDARAAAAVTEVIPPAAAGTDSSGIKWMSASIPAARRSTKTAPGAPSAMSIGAFAKKVEASLRAAAGATTPGPPVTTPAAPVTVVAPPAPPAAPAPPALPVPGANVVNSAYADFVKFVAEHSYSPQNPTGRLTEEYVASIIAYYTDNAITTMQDLAHRADLIPAVHSGLKQALGIA